MPKIDIEFEDETLEEIVEHIFARFSTDFSKESRETYQDALAEGVDWAEAVGRAIFNEFIIDLIREQVLLEERSTIHASSLL